MLEPQLPRDNSLPQAMPAGLTLLSRESRVARVLQILEDTQNAPQDRLVIRLRAGAALRDQHHGEAVLLALESNIKRGESPVSPLKAYYLIHSGTGTADKLRPDHLIALGRVLSDPELQKLKLEPVLERSFQQLVEEGRPVGALVILGELAKIFHKHLGFGRSNLLDQLQVASVDIAETNPTKDQGQWLLGTLRQCPPNPSPDKQLQELDALVEAMEVCREPPNEAAKERRFKLFKETLEHTTSAGVAGATTRVIRLSPLVDRLDVPDQVIAEFWELVTAPLIPELSDNTLVDNGSVPRLVKAIAADSFSPAEILGVLNLLRHVRTVVPIVLLTPVIQQLAYLTNTLEGASPEIRAVLYNLVERVATHLGEKADLLGITLNAITKLAENGPSQEAFGALETILELHGTENPEAYCSALAGLAEITRPGTPPDLVRTYQHAMQDERFRKASQSAALLKRLSLHSACYALSSAEDYSSLIDILSPIGKLTGHDPLLFLQVEPGLDEYRKIQEIFYSPLQGTYRAVGTTDTDAIGGAFNMLVPPLQKSLATWRRINDVHHGFGPLTYPTRRTPDGESPLLVRYAMDMGQVVMLNALDNTRFPGKGCLVHSLDTGRLFAARSTDAQGKDRPFLLYERAWPDLALEFKQLTKAQFVFTRGFIAITGVDDSRYSIDRDGQRVQYSLVIFNAHFENPFNEIALLVPTMLLREVLRGSFAAIEDFRGFDQRRKNVNASLPNPKVFARHPVYGRHVINLGLPETVLFGVSRNGSNPGLVQKAWFDYRRQDLEHNRQVRAVDKGFAQRRTMSIGFGTKTEAAVEEARQAMLNQKEPDGRDPLKPVDGYELYSEETRLMRARLILQRDHRFVLQQSDKLEDDAWELGRRLMNLYDLQRIGFAYYGRGLTLARGSAEEEVEQGEPEDASFNIASPLMLRELYRAHSLHATGVTDRARYAVLAVGDALNSAIAPDPEIIIDTYSMRGIIGKTQIQFSRGEMTDEDIGLWQTQILPRVKDSSGRIAEFRLCDRATLPDKLRKQIDLIKE